MGENDQKRPVWRKIRRNAGAGDPRARVIFSTTSRELTISEDGEEDARAVCIFQMKDYNPDESNGTFSYVVEYQQKWWVSSLFHQQGSSCTMNVQPTRSTQRLVGRC